MKINFVGNFGPSGSGEIADEIHIARSFEELGHTVQRIPRDIWREVCNGKWETNWEGQQPLENSDINIIAKWDKFEDGKYIKHLKFFTEAPVFYWCWDSVDLNIDWHRRMAQSADLYLSGELGRANEFRKHNIRFYYFQFDCVDGTIEIEHDQEKLYDVVYLGTYDNQSGRMDILKEINKEIPIEVWGNGDWSNNGFITHPAVFGKDANRIIAQSKIVLGTSCDPHLFGYWSNRVGRVLRAGGSLLQQYTPGMESFLHDYAEYFSNPQEAISKIRLHLANYNPHESLYSSENADTFTSQQKAKDLTILMKRYLIENNGKDWLLP
jgi:hypothetical protein